MRIEKIDDNQIRCTLTNEDLAARQIRLSELAYGTDKARVLFRDMLQQARTECGFSADGVPLLIEAVPLPSEALVLIITKVSSPDELDTRFSSFGPSVEIPSLNEEGREPTTVEKLIRAIRGSLSSDDSQEKGTAASAPAPQGSGAFPTREDYARMQEQLLMNRLFVFRSMSDAILAVRQAGTDTSSVESDLLYDEDAGLYYLFISMNSMEQVGAMQKLFVALSEYGNPEAAAYARRQQLLEHCRIIIARNALSELAQI